MDADLSHLIWLKFVITYDSSIYWRHKGDFCLYTQYVDIFNMYYWSQKLCFYVKVMYFGEITVLFSTVFGFLKGTLNKPKLGTHTGTLLFVEKEALFSA